MRKFLQFAKMLTGVLVDVSGSMKENLQVKDKPDDKQLTRAESIFTTIINIAKRESPNYQQANEKIFALAFGLNAVKTCDLFKLLDLLKTLKSPHYDDGRERLIDLLVKNGAPYVRSYVMDYLTDNKSSFIFEELSQNRSKLKEVIAGLPNECKDKFSHINGKMIVTTDKNLRSQVTIFNNFVEDWTGVKIPDIPFSMENKEKQATIKQAERIIKELIEDKLMTMSQPTTQTLNSAISLIEGASSSDREKPLSKQDVKNLVESIEPYIYGDTPICEALQQALDVFDDHPNDDNKVLFLFTDGDSQSMDGNPAEFAQQFRDRKVTVFVCLLTSNNISNPKRLYCESETKTWTYDQRNLFRLSSEIDNTHSAISVLLEQNWVVSASGKSRLFVQANHPKVIDEFSSLVKRMLENNDALLNIFARVKLDKYINKANKQFKPEEQKHGTCYAHAVATTLHLAMSRIYNREGGVPNFEELKDKLIEEYKKEGADTEKVLKECCPKYRLHYKEVDEDGARQAINARRPVIARFRLSYDKKDRQDQWKDFSDFYSKNAQGILEDKDIRPRKPGEETAGHAVVLIKSDPDSLTFINSWGTIWGNEGRFKIKNASVLKLQFFDVFWTLEDLKESEKVAYQMKGKDVGEEYLENIPESVKSLPYECPKCHQSSKAKEFAGHLLEATCPKCKKSFKPTPLGLVFNSY